MTEANETAVGVAYVAACGFYTDDYPDAVFYAAGDPVPAEVAGRVGAHVLTAVAQEKADGQDLAGGGAGGSDDAPAAPTPDSEVETQAEVAEGPDEDGGPETADESGASPTDAPAAASPRRRS